MLTLMSLRPYMLTILFVHQRGLLYQGLHSGGSMVTMGKAGLLGHSLGGYSLPSPGTPGTSADEKIL